VDAIDQSTAIRKGEELDTARVEAFLRRTVPGLEGPMRLAQFPSGHSNLTYLARFGARELVLRRPPHGTKAKSAHDMGREYRILSALQGVYPYGPRPLAYSEDAGIMNAPFYVMERIKGIVIRREFPPELSLNPGEIRELCRRLVQAQFELHAIDYRRAGLADFGKPEGYVRRQVAGWSQRYRAAHTPDAPDCEATMAWLERTMPPDSPTPGIIHNDFKLDNIVLHPDDPMRIIGVLDWEMATVGDPLMDLGCSLAYWIEKDDPPVLRALRFMPTDLPGCLTRAEIVHYYAELSGRRIESFDFYYVFGLFRLAVIIQQIYYRFYHGQTGDERFRSFVRGAFALDETAREIIRRTA
jgi:aminoglycoside phosphotransferase (APT) family kinase protein